MHKASYFEAMARSVGFEFLTDITHYSFPAFYSRVRDMFASHDAKKLYLAAQKEAQDNVLYSVRLISKNAPELKNATRLALAAASGDENHDYGSMFGERAGKYAAPGSVASMFSPAAYLTELYREAKDLHQSGSNLRLDTRRPDLQDLVLSQINMDEQVTTLSLSLSLSLSL